MNNFKVGDKVKCINAVNSLNYLQVNKIYTIKHVYNNKHISYICLKETEIPINSWSENRFVLYNPCEDILQGILNE